NGSVYLRPLAGQGTAALKLVASLPFLAPDPKENVTPARILRFSPDGRVLFASTDGWNSLWNVEAQRHWSYLEIPAISLTQGFSDIEVTGGSKVTSRTTQFRSLTFGVGGKALWVTAEGLHLVKSSFDNSGTLSLDKGPRLFQFDLRNVMEPILPVIE